MVMDDAVGAPVLPKSLYDLRDFGRVVSFWEDRVPPEVGAYFGSCLESWDWDHPDPEVERLWREHPEECLWSFTEGFLDHLRDQLGGSVTVLQVHLESVIRDGPVKYLDVDSWWPRAGSSGPGPDQSEYIFQEQPFRGLRRVGACMMALGKILSVVDEGHKIFEDGVDLSRYPNFSLARVGEALHEMGNQVRLRAERDLFQAREVVRWERGDYAEDNLRF